MAIRKSSEEKQTRKPKMPARSDERRHSHKPEQGESSVNKDVSASSAIGHVVTDEQYKSRVAQKAYELYAKRRGMTELDDWVEAERLVKSELIAEGQWAGSV